MAPYAALLNLNHAALGQPGNAARESAGSVVARELSGMIITQLLSGSTADTLCATVQSFCAAQRQTCQLVGDQVWTLALAQFGPTSPTEKLSLKGVLELETTATDHETFKEICNRLAVYFATLHRTAEVQWQIEMMTLPGRTDDPNYGMKMHALAVYYQDMMRFEAILEERENPPLTNPPPRLPDNLRFLFWIVHGKGGDALKVPVWTQHPRFNWYDVYTFLHTQDLPPGMDRLTNRLRYAVLSEFTTSDQEKTSLSHRINRGSTLALLDAVVFSVSNNVPLPLSVVQYEARPVARNILGYPVPPQPFVLPRQKS